MRRRAFIMLLGGAATAWPIRLQAQRTGLKRVTVVIPASADDQEWQLRLTAFVELLSRSGWSDGRNVQLEIQWVGGELSRYPAVARDLTTTGKPPDLIVAAANPLVAQFQSMTKTIPIVFIAVSDPVGGGFVTNIARPGGNMTGFENFQPELGGKWLALLKEAIRNMSRVGMLLQPETPAHNSFQRVIEAAAPKLDVQAISLPVHDGAEIEHAIASFAGGSDEGLIVFPHPLFFQNRDLIIVLTARHRLPAIYPFRYFAVDGGLISYGIDPVEQWRSAAGYVARILKGEKPGDLPVQALNKYEMVINLRTAKAIGLDLPSLMLNRADKVIE
jgi:putative ABC transport system substrate-binding protein